MRNIINYIFIGGFLFSIWSPFFKMINNPVDKISDTENRKLNSLPNFYPNELINYIKSYEKYFNDNFGFRTDLISWNSYLSVVVLNESFIPKVVMGSRGWLFYAQGLTDQPKIYQYTESELQTIKTTFDQQLTYLNSKGIMLIIVITPDKHSIYPEKLPFYLQNRAINPRRVQLVSYIKQFDDIAIIDLTEALLAKKSENDLFYKTDTHWNNYGSFVAYKEVMKVIKLKFTKVDILSKEDFQIDIKPRTDGDLLKMLTIPFKFMNDEEVIFSLNSESKLKKLTKEKQISTILISHDSFFDPQYQWGTTNFLANHFSKVINVSSGLDFDHSIIEKEMPDVVILETAERYL